MNITGDWKRWIAGYDIHGAYQDVPTNDAFFRFVNQWKPHYRICGGDLWDFKQLRKKADAYERRESMAVDVAEGQLWLETFRPTHFLRGNHDERLWDLAEQSEGVVADYAKLGIQRMEKIIAKLKCEMFEYNKREGVLRLGSLKFIHGYLLGITAARRTAMIYGSVVMGHGHGIQSATIEGIEPRAGFMCGCLCQLDFDYNRGLATTLSHEHGWAFGVVNIRTGSFIYWQARRVDSVWIVPSSMEIIE